MTLLSVLLEVTIYSWILFLIIVILKKFLKDKSSARFQYLIWFLLIARLCIPITFDTDIRLFVIPETDVLPSQDTYISEPAHKSTYIQDNTLRDRPLNSSQVMPQTNASKVDVESHAKELTNTNQKSTAKPTIRLTWEQVVIAIWIIGVISILSFFAVMTYQMNKKILSFADVPPKKITSMVDGCREDLSIKNHIPPYLMDNITTPALTVSLRPKLLLPTYMVESMDDEQILFALRHELTHYRRRDHIVTLILRVLEAIYWFNPIVWVASRRIQHDMETACDSDVVRDMGSVEKGSYAMTILDMFAQDKRPKFVLGMALSGTRQVAEERIRGIYKNAKMGGRTKLVVVMLVVSMLFSCFTTACQPTPEEHIVKSKDGDKLEKTIQSKPDTKGNNPQDSQNQQPIITKHSDSFQGADEKVTINIDADVLIPTGNMPVVEVKPHYIDMDQVKAMAKVLFHGNPVYEPMVSLSKDDLEAEILKLKKFISNEKAMLEYYGGEQKIVDEVKAEFEERIAQYEKLYDDALDTIELRETDWTFRPRAYYEDMVIYNDLLDGEDAESLELKKDFYDSEMITIDSKVLDYDARMTVFNQDNTKNISHYAYFTTGSSYTGDNTPYWEETDSQPMTMTREEAISMVQDALDQMGITNMELSSCHASGKPQPSSMLSEPGLGKEAANLAAAAGEGRDMDERDADEKGEDVYGYYMTFTPVFEGAAVHDMTFFDYHGDAGINQYAQTYQYEKLNVTVQRETITSFDWVAPMEQVRVESQNVPMISLEDAMETFKKQMQLEYTIGKLSRYAPENPDYDEYMNNIESGEIHITDISLGLMRMRIKDRPGAYRMAPAWVFLGYEQLYGKESYSDSEIQDPISDTPYMVINAIDGSIVDIYQGY